MRDTPYRSIILPIFADISLYLNALLLYSPSVLLHLSCITFILISDLPPFHSISLYFTALLLQCCVSFLYFLQCSLRFSFFFLIEFPS